MFKRIFKWLIDLGERGWTYTYDTATPAGNDTNHPPSQGDDRIREVKTSIQERENIDHYWPLTGTQVSDTDAGKHRKCSFIEAADIGTGAEGKPILGAQTASGKAELVFTDEDDNDVQLTSGGAINYSGVVKSDGTIALTADWDAGGYKITAETFESDVATGTAPFTVASTTVVTNLNADKLDGYDYNETEIKPFGSWASKSNDTVYQAATDGFVCAISTSGTSMYGYTDGSNPPTTARVRNASATGVSGITMPVKKDDYWKVTGAATVYWIPMGV